MDACSRLTVDTIGTISIDHLIWIDKSSTLLVAAVRPVMSGILYLFLFEQR